MATQTAMLASEAWIALRGNIPNYKAQAQNALLSLQGGPVSSDFVFRMLDQLAGAINAINTWRAVALLDAFATSMGYPGTYSTDLAANVTQAQACIAWIVANFPAASGFLQSHTLNADGSRTPRSFTSAQTLGLQTAMQAFIASIG